MESRERLGMQYLVTQTTAPSAKNYQVQIVSSVYMQMLCFRVNRENEKAGSQFNQSHFIGTHYGLEDCSKTGAKMGVGDHQ